MPIGRLASMRLGLAVAVAVVLVGAAPAHARAAATPQPIATLDERVPISALGDHVAYSVREAGGYRLTVARDGVVSTLPIAPRSAPFDVDLGTDAAGAVVATFSRCAAPDGPWNGRGCRLRVVDLASGRERAIGVPVVAGASDTSPSMWRGRVVFARNVRAERHDIDQIRYKAPGRRIRSLPHGVAPSRCPYRTGCRGLTVRGDVQGMDLGARLAAFRWFIQAPAVIGHGGTEVRAVRLSTGRSALVGAGFVGEVCTGSTDALEPLVPAVDGFRVFFGEIATECYKQQAFLVGADARTRRGTEGALRGTVIELARGGGALYALRAPTPEGERPPVCDAPGAPCVLERVKVPALTIARRPPSSPVY